MLRSSVRTERENEESSSRSVNKGKKDPRKESKSHAKKRGRNPRKKEAMMTEDGVSNLTENWGKKKSNALGAKVIG